MSQPLSTKPEPHTQECLADEDRAYRPRWLLLTPFLGKAPALTRRQWRVLGLVAAASFFEQYDLYLFTLALKQIQTGLGISEAELGLLGSVVRFGSLPAFFVALVADRIGRRRVLLFTILAYTLFTGATAFAPDPWTFVAMQFFARMFATAETLIAVVVIAEEFDPTVRGWGIGAFGAIQSCGAGLAALLFALVGRIENGWRGLYLVGLIPLLLLAYWRRTMPETARFEAQVLVQTDEARLGRIARPVINLFYLYPGRLLMTASVVFITAIAEAAANLYGAKYLQEVHGWTPGAVGMMTFCGGAFAIVGNTFAGWLSDQIGRKRVSIGFLIGQVMFTIAFYNTAGGLIIPSWILMIFTVLGANVTLAAYGVELFPTSSRSTAAGTRVLLLTIGASLGLALESLLYSICGSHWTAVSILVSFTLLGPVVIAMFFPETSGRSLEEIAPER